MKINVEMKKNKKIVAGMKKIHIFAALKSD